MPRGYAGCRPAEPQVAARDPAGASPRTSPGGQTRAMASIPERPAVPLPIDEAARVASVLATGLLDTEPDPLFDTVTDLVAAALGVPIALVTLVDDRRQWFLSRHGLDLAQTRRDDALCAHAIVQPDEVFVIEDAAADARFAGNPLVTGPPHIRFYAGAPVRAPDSQPVGTLCVIDREPRSLSPTDHDLLFRAARQVEVLLAVRLERDAAVGEQDWVRSLNGQLREASEARTRFLAVAQHKLKTPLAVISGWSAVLQDWELLDDEERSGGLAAISRSTTELQAQIDDLLDEARANVLEQSLQSEELELEPILAGQIAALRFDVEPHPIDLDVDPGLRVRADEDALRHVLSHLLDNAIKYSPDGGAIAVTARRADDRAVIAVRDHGIGLPEDVDVFEPFQRGQTASGVARGTGLGLYIVRSLTGSMRGTVTATRPADGGTSIEVDLPAG